MNFANVFLVLAAVTSNYAAQEHLPPEAVVRVRFAPSASKISLGEPVTVNMILRNDSSEPLVAHLGRNRQEDIGFVITDPEGGNKEVKQLPKEGIYRLGDVSIGAHEEFASQIPLGLWYRFDKIGEYKIQVKFGSRVTSKSEKPANVSIDGAFTLSVRPADAAHLASVCSELLARVSSAPTYDKALAAANALASIPDSIAIPYLRDATQYWHLQPITVNAIEQIGTSESVEALIGFLKSSDPDTRALSRSALSRIQMETKNDTEKQTIRDALKEYRP